MSGIYPEQGDPLMIFLGAFFLLFISDTYKLRRDEPSFVQVGYDG